MNMFNQLNKGFEEQFGAMKPVAKPYTREELAAKDRAEYHEGMSDCAAGKPNQNVSNHYNEGYMFQTAYQISAEAKQ